MRNIKKAVLIWIVLIMALLLCLSAAGCNNESIIPGEDNGKEETEEKLGNFYTLELAYEYGWLDVNDLKSIACGYYELLHFDIYSDYENLYSGMFDPHEELSEDKALEIKQAYLNQPWIKQLIPNTASTDGVTIANYYGTYNGNIVVSLFCNYFSVDIKDDAIKEVYDIGGVIFYTFCPDDILVYHIDSYEELGTFYTLERAYEYGWLDVDDLKSIACGFYEFYHRDENPYSGMFDPHEDLSKKKELELKLAYLNQPSIKQLLQNTKTSPDGVKIMQYYGTYNGNIVVNILCDYFKVDKIIEDVYDVGDVIFYTFCPDDILVYHID